MHKMLKLAYSRKYCTKMQQNIEQCQGPPNTLSGCSKYVYTKS